MRKQAIGIFDSGYGGLTILKDIVERLPQYDYIYLGDNARAPYGNKSFDTVYEYTLQGVKTLFNKGCELVLLACNTSSAKALRSIQQKDLQKWNSTKRVLGVIRPTTERLNTFTTTNKIGLFATTGTVRAQSYVIEGQKLFPEITLYQEDCPIWVPLIENNELANKGTDYFVQQHVNHLLAIDKDIDAIILACTHYPLLSSTIRKFLPPSIKLISQGILVATALESYLQRHSELEQLLSTNQSVQYFTTGDAEIFNQRSTVFLKQTIRANSLHL